VIVERLFYHTTYTYNKTFVFYMSCCCKITVNFCNTETVGGIIIWKKQLTINHNQNFNSLVLFLLNIKMKVIYFNLTDIVKLICVVNHK
jgi:hypothetical protein